MSKADEMSNLFLIYFLLSVVYLKNNKDYLLETITPNEINKKVMSIKK